MDADLATSGIERTVELDVTADEAWRLIGTAAGWREWLADEAAVDVRDGEVGVVTDDGVRRTARIERVVAGESVTFVWSTGDDDVARVTLRLEEIGDGRRLLRVTEAPVAACADCPLRGAERWDLRACLLCVAALTTSRV